MVAQAVVAGARTASGGVARLIFLLFSLLLSLLPRAVQRRPPPPDPIAADPDSAHLLHVVRLYLLVLETLPDRPGLRHHADLLANGSTLAELAASLLAVSRRAGGDRKAAARVFWLRAGGGSLGFEPAWSRSSGLADFVAGLVRHPIDPGHSVLPTVFPDGIDPALADAGPAWAYRLWAVEIDAVLRRLALGALPTLRLLGARIVLDVTMRRDTAPALLDASLQALARQCYGRWRARLHGEPPPGWSPPTDPRIAWCRSGADAWHPVLPRPTLHGVLWPGEVLAPFCLALFARAALRRPLVAVWRCDEDLINPDGLREQPRLRLDGGLALSRRSARAAAGPERLLPAVLLHRRAFGPSAPAPQLAATSTLPSASLVIVTRDRPALLRRCLDSIRVTTGAAGSPGAPELVIVDNGSVNADALVLLERCQAEGCVVLRRPGPFNWSALCNQGVRAGTGAVLVLLNNDVECLRPGWLPCLLRGCLDPRVGVVGATLLFGDGRVQHNGVLVGSRPGRGWRLVPVAAHRLDAADPPGPGMRSVSAVTGACMAFRREVFDRLGGLEEALPVTWNDLDFCFRAREAGLAVRVASGCVLRHDELGTRTPDTAPENRAQLADTIAFVARRHGRSLRGGDRFLHPFLLFASGARLLDPAAASHVARLLRAGGIAVGIGGETAAG